MRYFRSAKEVAYYSYRIWEYIAENTEEIDPALGTDILSIKEEAIRAVCPWHLVELEGDFYCPCCVEYREGDCEGCPGKPIWPKGCEKGDSPYLRVFRVLEESTEDLNVEEIRQIVKENAAIISNHFKSLI